VILPCRCKPTSAAYSRPCCALRIAHCRCLVAPICSSQALREDLTFEPPLPPKRVEALSRLNIGNGLKMFLLFSRRVWPEDCHGVICAETFVPEMWFKVNHVKGKGDIYTATVFAMADRANEIAAMPEATAISLALSQVGVHHA
jgi:monoamine oxidase